MRFGKTLLEFHSLNSHYPSVISFTQNEQSLAGLSNAFGAVCSLLSKASVPFWGLSAFPPSFWPKMPGGDALWGLTSVTPMGHPGWGALEPCKARPEGTSPAQLLSGCKNCSWEMKNKIKKKRHCITSRRMLPPQAALFYFRSPHLLLHHFFHPLLKANRS